MCTKYLQCSLCFSKYSFYMYWSFKNDTNSKMCNQIAKTSCYFIPNICILSNIKDKNMFVITINSWKHVTKGRMWKREISGAWIKRTGCLRPFLGNINLLDKKSSLKRCRKILTPIYLIFFLYLMTVHNLKILYFKL